MEQQESQGIMYQTTTSMDTWWKDTHKDRLTIPPDDTLKCLILRTWHSTLAGGHLGQDETMRKITDHYHWICYGPESRRVFRCLVAFVILARMLVKV